MTGILDQIIANKQQELRALRARRFSQRLAPRAVDLARGSAGELKLIAEIKFRSPSAGALSQRLTVEQRAQAYTAGGATLLSVLCDEKYFAGSYEHLAQARVACDTPLLCKEFVIDEIQLDAARAYGADAVLLIVRCLPGRRLEELIVAAEARGLLPLVEVYKQDEAERSLDAGARVIGVNSRDLNTLEMDAVRAAKILAALPEGTIRLHLSGIKNSADVQHIRESGVDAALIGETLMRQDDPEPMLRELVRAARD